VWGLACIGILLKVARPTGQQSPSMCLYLAMGWIVIIAIKPMWLNVPLWGLFWLMAGGIAYTVGVVFYSIDEKVRYSHTVWHVFVVAGTACHFVAVLWYAS